MRFHCALGNIQIPGDFRVVTPLEQKIDDLPFPRTYSVEVIFHAARLSADASPVALKWLNQAFP